MQHLLDSRKQRRAFRRGCRRGIQREPAAGGEVQIGTGKFKTEVAVVSTTILYRHLATTCVETSDRVVEIGCSYGSCCALLAQHADAVIGVEMSADIVAQARCLHPQCDFMEGDILAEDVSWLDPNSTVLFLDIGGNRDYRTVMRALAISLSSMPSLRLVVVKSTELRSFLLQSDDSVTIVAQDLDINRSSGIDVAEDLAVEIRRRGGEMPVNHIFFLQCGPRLRYTVGKKRLCKFLTDHAPLFDVVEALDGPQHLRLRVRTAPGPIPCSDQVAAAATELRKELAVRLSDVVPLGAEIPFLQVFARIRKSFLNRYLAVAANPDFYRQASDKSLDERGVEEWSDTWLSVVAMRHLHAFLASSEGFYFMGNVSGDVLTVTELCELRVCRAAQLSAETAVLPDAAAIPELATGSEVALQVLDSNWCEREGEEGDKLPELQRVFLDQAWLLRAGSVVQRLDQKLDEPVADSGFSSN